MTNMETHYAMDQADLIMKCFEDSGKHFVVVVKDKNCASGKLYEVLNTNLDGNLLIMKEIIRLDVTL